jgi:hypothetical protein
MGKDAGRKAEQREEVDRVMLLNVHAQSRKEQSIVGFH